MTKWYLDSDTGNIVLLSVSLVHKDILLRIAFHVPMRLEKAA